MYNTGSMLEARGKTKRETKKHQTKTSVISYWICTYRPIGFDRRPSVILNEYFGAIVVVAAEVEAPIPTSNNPSTTTTGTFSWLSVR